MFCLSSSDSAFSFSRYSASARSLSSTRFCWLASSLSSQSSIPCVDRSLISRFSATYSSISALTASAANFGSSEMKVTSTRWLPRTGTTSTRPTNAPTIADSSAVSSGLGGSGVAAGAGFET